MFTYNTVLKHSLIWLYLTQFNIENIEYFRLWKLPDIFCYEIEFLVLLAAKFVIVS